MRSLWTTSFLLLQLNGIHLACFPTSSLIEKLLSNKSNSSLRGNDTNNETSHFDFSKLLRLRENDWRDAWDKPQIIWSPESRHHPDWGRHAATLSTEEKGRATRSSRVFSFLILGGVIGFVLYTYFAHVLLMRRLREREERAHLAALIQCSALIMASSAGHHQPTPPQRRRSLINMFRAFRL
ncbi:unnamed protein product, partial [Mesorhabditis belari]|uniref:Transmembrane protein n=1 Tax=Mesorhabditis belari TaxID=2138241 RepID=A0AAF3E9P7_9BILA